jgi:hypothetical protein
MSGGPAPSFGDPVAEFPFGIHACRSRRDVRLRASGGARGERGTWSIVGQRDFNGDGKADLVWRDTSGNTAMWFMNGTIVASSVVVGNVPTNWTVQGMNAE